MNRFFADRLPETRPAGARIEFRLRAVKRIAARRADVSAVVEICAFGRVNGGGERRCAVACETIESKCFEDSI